MKKNNKASYRVLRGGSWFSYDYSSRVARRDSFTPDVSGNGLGFRLVVIKKTK